MSESKPIDASPEDLKRAKQIEMAITRLSNFDADFVETLFMVSKFAEKNPVKFKMVRSMLKKEVAAILKKERG